MNDATVVVFCSGNFEYIGLRERSTGKLYISDLLHLREMRDPAYGELETAVQAFAVREHLVRFRAARRRARRGNAGGGNDDDDDDDDNYDYMDEDSGDKKGGNGGGGSGKHNRRRGPGDEDEGKDKDHRRHPKRRRHNNTSAKDTKAQPSAGPSGGVRQAIVEVGVQL
jgi:hypothetical protein